MNLSADSKSKLLAHCYEYVDNRMATAREAMNNAQESANAEGKSSMGDKYETGRAMMQIEKEKAFEQLNEGLKLRNVLDQIKDAPSSSFVALGSLVLTKDLCIFISIGAGKLVVDGIEFLVVAPASPLGKSVLKLKKGDPFIFNKQTQIIESIL